MVKFLHAGDLHLGLRITRFEEAACERIVEARFTALDALLQEAREHKADFLVLAGDVFDDHSVSKGTAERAYHILEGSHMPCPVVIIPGNHDPLIAGGVWDRPPWNADNGQHTALLLREARPIPFPGVPVTLFPCPLRHRKSVDDPTAWISNHPRSAEDRSIRIGIAHGSLRVLPNLPEDDHLIPCDAAERLGLDYLALGHWHKPSRYMSPDGAERTAYSGTHEPMRFPGAATDAATGWAPYSTGGDQDRFADDGRGTAQLVTIDCPGAPPRIETIETGRLRWIDRHVDVSSTESLGQIISAYAQEERPETTVLRLRLMGVLAPESYSRIEHELEKIIGGRYHAGSTLDASAVLIEPAPDELRERVGDGVLSRVLQRLQEEATSSDDATQRVARHALKLLYRLAWEVHE